MFDTLPFNAEYCRIKQMKSIEGFVMCRVSYATPNGISVRYLNTPRSYITSGAGQNTDFGRVVSVEQVGF